MVYEWLFLVITILPGQDMEIETIQATDIASCEELRIEQKKLLEARAKTEDNLAWHVGECRTESPFLHNHRYN